MKKYLTKTGKIVIGAVTIILVVVALSFTKLPYYTLRPGPYEEISNDIYSLSVNVAETSVLSYVSSIFDKEKSLIDKSTSTKKQLNYANQFNLYFESDFLAKQFAYDYSDMEYMVQTTGYRVIWLDEVIEGINIGDIITTIDGKAITHNQVYPLTDSKLTNGTIATLSSGVEVDISAIRTKIHLEIAQDIDATENIELISNSKLNAGSSASVARFIYYYAKLNDIILTKPIAATGAIEKDGSIIPITGIKQKLYSLENTDIRVVFVAADNYDEAIKVVDEMKTNITILKVNDLNDVIDFLKVFN